MAQDVECPRVSVGNWDVAPSFRDSIPVEYPYMAHLAGIEGTVCVATTILESGVPCRVTPVSGPVPLHAAAMDAARSSRYIPASKAGLAVPGVMQICYVFRLADAVLQRTVWPAPDSRRPRVSDVTAGRLRSTAGGVEYTEYRYSNLVVRGDMSVALCDSVLSLIEGKLLPGEEVVRVTHYLALPPTWDPDYKWKWRDTGDLTVEVQPVPTDGAMVRKQRIYRFFERNGHYELSDVVSLVRYD